MDPENLDDAAPLDGQTADEAVAEAPSDVPSGESEQAEASQEQTSPARLYAGKFKSPEELEQSYLNSEREASRMAGELASYRKAQPTTQPASEPAWKKLETERNKWAQYAAQAGLTEDQRAHAWNQVSLHDRDIAEARAIERFQEMSTKQYASRELEDEVLDTFQHYQQDLSQQGSQLYHAAEQLYIKVKAAMGLKEDSNVLREWAVLKAAHKTGVSKSKAISTDRKDFLGTLNKQAKAAVKAGAGTATTVKAGGVTAKQIEAMDDAAFAKFERENVLGA